MGVVYLKIGNGCCAMPPSCVSQQGLDRFVLDLS
jgi:hypothetical protein